jgi:hypothetical protein
LTFQMITISAIPEGTYLPVTGVHWVFLESLPPGKHEI